MQETLGEIHNRRLNYAHMSSAVDLSKPPGLVLLNSSAHHFLEFDKITSYVPPGIVPGLVAYQKFQDAPEPLVCTTAVYLPHGSNDKVKIQPFQAEGTAMCYEHYIFFF